MGRPQVLADTLTQVSEVEYVRYVADWLTHADNLDVAPDSTGIPVIDALVAAAAAHVAFTNTGAVPAWTETNDRFLTSFWYPGPNGLFPNALVHSPPSFKIHRVLIEADSLVSV
ncbi:hypothetical protein [Tessaracoccus sp.]